MENYGSVEDNRIGNQKTEKMIGGGKNGRWCTHLLSIGLSLVIWHALWIGKLLLRMHSSGRHGGAAVLRVWRTLRHLAWRLEWRGHTATHLLRHGAVWLWRVVCHLWVVVSLRVPTTAAARRVASTHVCIAHVAVCRLGGFTAQMLSLRKRMRVGLRGHGRASLYVD